MNTLNNWTPKDDDEYIKDSATNADVENSIVEEQEDNEIQDSGFVDKRKVNKHLLCLLKKEYLLLKSH